MRGYYFSGVIGGPGWEPDAFCYSCGAAFPWTADAKQAADEVIDLLDGLSDGERAQLKGTLDDLMTDTPKTEIAATKFKLLARKTGQEGGVALRAIVTSVATGAAKRLILGG